MIDCLKISGSLFFYLAKRMRGDDKADAPKGHYQHKKAV